jgi:hypothetical protein
MLVVPESVVPDSLGEVMSGLLPRGWLFGVAEGGHVEQDHGIVVGVPGSAR